MGEPHDPGLGPAGLAGSDAVADRLAAAVAPCRLRSSPLRRAQETAAPLARRWGAVVDVDPVIREVPSPTRSLAERSQWLRSSLSGRWDDAGDEVVGWRDAIVAAARAVEAPEVWFTHFVVINALVAAITGSDRVTVVRPGYCGVLELVVSGGDVSIVALPGGEESTIR